MKKSRHKIIGTSDILYMDDSERSKKVLQMIDEAGIAVWIEKAKPGETRDRSITGEGFPVIITVEGTFDTDEGLEWWIKKRWPKSIKGKEDQLCEVPDHLNFCYADECK